jgi:hypothetical protein
VAITSRDASEASVDGSDIPTIDPNRTCVRISMRLYPPSVLRVIIAVSCGDEQGSVVGPGGVSSVSDGED